MYKLVVEDDDGKTTEVPLLDDVITIGRKEGSTVHLSERNISRLHAKLIRTDGKLRIEDFSSYTGVIVNGKRIQGKTQISAGDRIAIGDYRIELSMEPDLKGAFPARNSASRMTVPDDASEQGSGLFGTASTEPPPTRSPAPAIAEPPLRLPVSRAPLVVAFGIVSLAAVIAGVVLFDAVKKRQSERTAGSTVTSSSSAEKFWVSLRDCQQALEGQNYAKAVGLGRDLVRMRPDSEQGRQCRDVAERALTEQAAFTKGRALFEQGRVEEAYLQFQANLSESSAFRNRSEVIQTNRLYAELRLESAEELVKSDPIRAQSVLDELLGMTHAPVRVRQRAELLSQNLESSASPTRAKVTKPPVLASVSAPRVAPERRATPIEAPKEASKPAPAPKGLAAARECLKYGNNACALEALSQVNGPSELALRIATHRQMGNQNAAIRDMTLYIQRYPSDARSTEYRQFLLLKEQPTE
ncbi:MAG: FHA domain-containing protein [Myxococcales bacterium]|nr:MAG: FHA domain-containing protein [Myxococcales bacterium]